MFTLLALKAKDLEELVIVNMQNTTLQVRQDMANFAILTIYQAPLNLNVLDFGKSGFSSDTGECICSALVDSNITTLTNLSLAHNPGWFDTE